MSVSEKNELAHPTNAGWYMEAQYCMRQCKNKKNKRKVINICYTLASAMLVMSLLTAMPTGGITAHATNRAETVDAAVSDTPAPSTSTLASLAAGRDIMALVYLCEEYDVHSGPSLDSSVVATLISGQTVYIQDATYNKEEGILWIYASFQGESGMGSGYIERQQLACSDERFLDWEQSYSQAMGIPDTTGHRLYASDGGIPADIAQFPESYQSALVRLKQLHPQWVFVPLETGLDWDTVISKELAGGKSLVHKSLPDYTKEGAYDDGNWFYASREILEYYMDPRNGLTEDRIFQFELLTYNESYHTEKAVDNFLQNTFMRSPNRAPGTDMTYAHIFWAVGAEDVCQTSPFHLAARVYQEQGQGTSGLISGTYPGYEGYYNYFNVGATGTTTTQVIENGLKYAKEHDWNSAYFSIRGGAHVISANYIRKGQDTLYLQKYNVNPKAEKPLYKHQYMQNISAPTTEGTSIRKLYAKADSLDNSFVFKIPVYRNMPQLPCAYPSASTNVVLQIPAGYDDTVWIEGSPYAVQTRNGRQIAKAADDQATSAVVYSYDDAGVPNGMYVWTLTYQDGAYTATAQPKLEDLLSYEGFSIRISGDPGMRVKTSIDASLKNTLIKSGIGGYTLKEYGTLMTDRNLQGEFAPGAYPLVKDGAGVLTGMAYGTDDQGGQQDLVYETVGGRQRFTSVLVGLPESSYNKTYFFRGYVVLGRNGQECVIYGPVVSRSMASLAQQVLDSGDYAKDSDAYLYLKQIVEVAK